MVCYVVERHLVGWTSDEVDALLSRLDEATEAMADEGVRYLGSVVLPTDEICLGLFTGADAAAVTAANVARGMPVERVLLARTATLGGAAA